jgi:hypothetical protein
MRSFARRSGRTNRKDFDAPGLERCRTRHGYASFIASTCTPALDKNGSRATKKIPHVEIIEEIIRRTETRSPLSLTYLLGTG